MNNIHHSEKMDGWAFPEIALLGETPPRHFKLSHESATDCLSHAAGLCTQGRPTRELIGLLALMPGVLDDAIGQAHIPVCACLPTTQCLYSQRHEVAHCFVHHCAGRATAICEERRQTQSVHPTRDKGWIVPCTPTLDENDVHLPPLLAAWLRFLYQRRHLQ